MAPAAVGTLVATFVLVAALAIYLILIAVNLRKISAALDTVYGAVEGIAGQVEPAPGVVAAIANDVSAIQSALHGLITLATSGPAPAPVAAPPTASGPRRRRVAVAPDATEAPAAEPARPRGPNFPPPIHAGRRR
jgi:hypothetical protein